MASSGTIKSAIRTGYAIQIAWTVDSQSVANNTSTVTAKVQLVSTGSSKIGSAVSKSFKLTVPASVVPTIGSVAVRILMILLNRDFMPFLQQPFPAL